ncbi:phosphotransferase [Novosphingobium sp.]|uniref:phosphotransferase family protein n=1 Tax=Novosphingobium sp. TaxID=1874826 RepID=UPI003342DAB5
MALFPATADAVSPAWLESRLKASGAMSDGHIVALSHVPIGTGQVGDTARFTIDYDRPGAGPATVAGKFAAADPTSRSTAAMLGLYAREVHFYRELAPRLAVRTPQVYASGLDDDGASFVLLFEDLGPARGGNQLQGCTIADARHAVRQAAALHAPTFCAPWLRDAAWLQPVPGLLDRLTTLYPQAHGVFRDRYDGLLAPELMAVCDALCADIAGYYARDPAQRAVCHGDFRLDNMLFDARDGADPIAVVDWQTAGADCPLKDLAYFLGCGIGSTVRRAHEDELIALYCEDMARAGVAFTRDAIWYRYRLGALHGVATAVFSAAFVVRTDRGDANFLSMARNACELALDHDSVGALKTCLETGSC